MHFWEYGVSISRSTSQEIPSILWITKVYNHVHKKPATGPYSELEESSIHSHTLFFLPLVPRFPKETVPFRVF
jgi:hypothetical protein